MGIGTHDNAGTNTSSLAIWFGPDEIRDALACTDEYERMLEVLTDTQLERAAETYLLDTDEPWSLFERMAKQIVRDAYTNSIEQTAAAYELDIDAAISSNDAKGEILRLIGDVIQSERRRRD